MQVDKRQQITAAQVLLKREINYHLKMEENLEIGERTRLRQQQGSNPGNRIIQFDIVKTLDAHVKTLDAHRQ